MPSNHEIFPALPLEEWEPTKDTLHLYLQIVGKIRLALAPRKNHWWFITFYVSPEGLTTSAIPYGHFTFEIKFDFQQHKLIINTNRGRSRSIELRNGLSVAEFYYQLFAHLKDLGIEAKIIAEPYDHKCKEPFAICKSYASYDSEYVHRFWQILVQIDMIFKEFSGRFYGKTSSVQLYWHHMDLVVTRFSGRRGPKREGGTVADKDAYSHEVVSAGFWAGDDQVREPAFYCYTYPAPKGLEEEPLAPASARWIDSNGSPMAFMIYNDLRQDQDPKNGLLEFLESSYLAGANRAGWDIEDLKVQPL